MPRHSYREHDSIFGQAMLTLRKSLRLTQAGLADLLGVSRRAIGEWEGGLNIDQGLPETRSPDGKPDEPGNARRCLQPLLDPFSLCTASQHNETHGVPSTPPSHLFHLDSLFPAIKPFDLPDIRLHPGGLQRLDGLHH